jgi:hypothetical protein
MAPNKLVLFILLQAVYGHRRAVVAQVKNQLILDKVANVSAEKDVGAMSDADGNSIGDVEGAVFAAGLDAGEKDIEAVSAASSDSMLEKSNSHQLREKRVTGWNQGAVQNSAGKNIKPGKLTTFQQAPGWCYANAASTMNRYYSNGNLKQCDVATNSCHLLSHQRGVDCCDGPVPDGGYPSTQQDPKNDFRMASGNTTYHMHFNYERRCCGSFGGFTAAFTSDPAIQPIKDYYRGKGKTMRQLRAAINADKPFIMGTTTIGMFAMATGSCARRYIL